MIDLGRKGNLRKKRNKCGMVKKRNKCGMVKIFARIFERKERRLGALVLWLVFVTLGGLNG